MASPSVTHTFANSTTADATQVNTNFTDIINSLTDGSKDLSISALTLAGNFTANGTTNTIGSASGDDLVINASLASSIPIKTTYSYDIGTSAIGLRSVYLGDAGSAARSTRVIGATIASAYTLTLPTGAGSAGQGVTNLGSGSLAFLPGNSNELQNLAIAASVGSSILTVALKGADGNDPSATNPVYITFRSATATTGTPIIRAVTGALSVQATSGSTLGHASALAHYVYVYAIDNAGTVELAISSALFDDGTILTTTAEGGAGGADSARIIYSSSARSNVAVRLLGRLKSTQATAGTWATAIAEISLAPFYAPLIACRYTTNTAQNLVTGTIVDFEDKDYDTHNAVVVGASWAFTAPATRIYRISTRITTASASAAAITNTIAMRLSLNAGAATTFICLQYATTTSSMGKSAAGSIQIKLIAGETISLLGVNSTGQTHALDAGADENYIEICEVTPYV